MDMGRWAYMYTVMVSFVGFSSTNHSAPYYTAHDIVIQKPTNCKGIEDIKASIPKLHLNHSRIDLTNGYLEAQSSENSAVFVLVSGHYFPPVDAANSRNSAPLPQGIPFVQSFYLACQQELADGATSGPRKV